MQCCSECFSSSYLKNIIESRGAMGDCDFCNSKEVATYQPKELAIFFQNIFDLYKRDSKNGESIEIKLESDFKGKIFSDKIIVNRKKLLNEIVAEDFSKYKTIFANKVSLNRVIDNTSKLRVLPLQTSWDKFAEEIKTTNRFHIQNTLDLGRLAQLLKRYERHIHSGSKYYRARISDSKSGFKISEMKNPPVEKAKAGRANPMGISYLYLANDLLTTLYEARASLYDYVTVGTFRLKEDIKVINLRGDTYDPIYLAEQGELEEFLIHLPFITKLEKELSKPRRRSDIELDYLPTQYLSEFIKSLGFDGVEFQSSLYPLGYNLAVFKPDKFQCIKAKVYDIEKINLTHKLIH